ncbi:hypothetical protein B9T26_02075 [Acinetobacter sp. ANC 4169]|uniref:DcaP family trimeric outer membrane transporter n=1 Tax=Acinetobacter sp. ANC 4169 TaxID=1977879 RepID=UPI000A344087|nr:DcaP family trimeric outer membrane transporter [Acinetobacter sp. ANC 4169]OTG76618.1 hypothetical protein B9T26_02075 [Acinetobacter sp. ANC 4169]
MNTQNNLFKLKTLVLAVGLSSTALVHAQSATEVEQLRKEVKELRSLIEQYATQSKQQGEEIKSYQAQVSASPIQATEKKPAKDKKGLAMSLGGAEVSFYGNVRADASYQAEGGAASRLYNQINTVPLEGTGERSDEFKSTLSATRLGMDFKTATSQGDVGGKVEVDFLGGPNFDNLRIRHAYLTYADWLIGQTWSNFAVPDYMPETVDALAYVGGSVKRTPQVRHTTKFTPKTNLVMALEDPKNASITQRLPALTARLNHQFANNFNVSARAMGHEKRVNNNEEMAWGVGLGAKYEVIPGTTLKADYYHVKGDSSFVSYSNSGVVAQAEGGLVQSEFDSVTVGLTQQFNEKLRGTVGYGYMTFDENQDYINALTNKTAANKDLWQAWANVFYSPTKPLSFGLEYVYGEREAFAAAPNGSKTGEDNRLNVVAIYNF